METYCKVLIIDDEFIMRQGMKHMLDWEKEGFQIVGEATNGQEGLDLIEKLEPDIVLADIVMPVLDGIEFSSIVQQRFPEVQLVMLSGYDKFEYVKETLLNGATDYILKSTLNPEILLKTLNKAVRKIPGMHLVKGTQISYSRQIEKVLLGYEEKLYVPAFAEVFPHTLFRIMGTNLKQMCYGQKENMSRIEEKITSFFEERKEYAGIPFFIEEEYFCFVFNFRIKDEKSVLADMETCIDKTAKIRKEAFFVISQSFSKMQEMKTCYQTEIRPFMDLGFYYPGQHLLMIQNQKKKEEPVRFAFEKYMNCMVHKRFDQALSMFMDYVHEMCECQLEEYKMKNLTKNLLYNYLIETENYGISSEELKSKYFDQIDHAAYADDFFKVMAKIYEELSDLRKEKMEVDDERVMEVKTYISEHYAEDLTLADIAANFGFSYNYLSAYFHKQTKEGFSEYLNRVRIEKACRLLSTTNSSIAEISSRTGYSDHTYFSRIFKKITGVTPSHYRRKNRR